MAQQILISADPRPIYKDLRRGRYRVLFLESVGFITACQVVILDFIAMSVKQIELFDAIRAHVVRHDHPVNDCCVPRVGLHSGPLIYERRYVFISSLRRPDIDHIASQHRHTDAAPYQWTGEQQDGNEH